MDLHGSVRGFRVKESGKGGFLDLKQWLFLS